MTGSRDAGPDSLLRRLLGPTGAEILGDLDEEWLERLDELGPVRARLWYVRMVVASITSVWGGRVADELTSRRRGSGIGWLGLARHEIRSLVRAPLWSALAIGTLSVGMLFTVVVHGFSVAVRDTLLPYPSPEQLVYLAEANTVAEAVADPTLRRLQAREHLFESIAAWSRPVEANLSRGDAEPSVVRTASVLPGTPEALGIEPVRGRLFTADDENPSLLAPALISWGWWIREFGADPAVIGARVAINGRDYQVIGVLPADARLPGGSTDGASADLWLPLIRLPALEFDPGLRYQVAVRVRPGFGADEVRDVGQEIMDDLRSTLPGWRTDPAWHVVARSFHEQYAASAKDALRSLILSAALLLALGSANLIALTLARGQQRRREFSVHAALGASPSIGLKRTVVQNLLIAAMATIIAIPAGAAVLSLTRQVGVSWLAGLESARLQPRTAAMAAIVALLLSLGVALLTSWTGRRASTGIGGLGSRTPDRRWKWLARGLVLVETALVVALGIGAGLMARTFENLSSVETGIETADRFATRVSLTGPSWVDPAVVAQFREGFLDRIREMPGVRNAAFSTSAPLSNTIWNFGEIEGAFVDGGEEMPTVEIDMVSSGYMATLGLSPVAGRTLDRDDADPSSEPSIVINEALAALFPEAALGGRIRFGDRPWLRVVGVVPDIPSGRLDQGARPRVYLTDLALAFPWQTGTTWFLIQSDENLSAGQLQRSLTTLLAEMEAELPLYPVRPLDALRADLLRATRTRMVLFGILGIVALMLGTAGIHGVVAHSLGTVRHETGVRLALGATRRRVFAGTLSAIGGAALVGGAFGVVAASQLGRLLGAFLFGVGPIQVDLYLVVLAMVGSIAALAIVAPAWRAASADPVRSLRAD